MNNLLNQVMGDTVQPANLTKKLTINGATKAYPVYRVRLDQLFYNDQNDRIATWISQYKNENPEAVLSDMNREIYNKVIENFIVQSNPTAIEKTQMNIALVGQREPGVTLSDGRIIDGNRRYTCLRRLAENEKEYNWFETVILDTSIESSKKQIKMLELAIQHGEEKKVDYNPIDRLVGVYQDIIETQLLTVDEYAESTNESVSEVKKKIESALLLVEFLEYIHLPKQYHVARDYQVISIISDLQLLLRKCSTQELKEKVKRAVFANIMMHTVGDSRKFTRNISSMMDAGFFGVYMKEQERIGEVLQSELEAAAPKNKQELDTFVSMHEEAAEELQLSLDKSLLKAKKNETRSKPSRIVSKSITLLKDVDTRIFEKLTDLEKENLKSQVDKLATVVERFDTMLEPDGSDEANDKPKDSVERPASVTSTIVKNINSEETKQRYYIAKKRLEEPEIYCLNCGRTLTSLSVKMEFRAAQAEEGQKSTTTYRGFFIDNKNEIISDIQELKVAAGERIDAVFTLSSKSSSAKQCYLALQAAGDLPDELQQLIPFKIAIAFTSDMDF